MAWLLLATLAVGWAWMEALRARETALAACARACRQIDAQLLDETVALQALWFARDGSGQMRWRRRYGFEFSLDGVGRHRGEVILLGRRVLSLWLDHPDGSLYLPPR